MQADGESPDVRPNNLNEKLEFVGHSYSDKTGTFTENIIRFTACIVPGASTIDVRNKLAAFCNAVFNSTDARHQATAIAFAHDIVPSHVEGKADVEYQGKSANEAAHLDGAREGGILVTRLVSLLRQNSGKVWTCTNFKLALTGSHWERQHIDLKDMQLHSSCVYKVTVTEERSYPAPGCQALGELLEFSSFSIKALA